MSILGSPILGSFDVPLVQRSRGSTGKKVEGSTAPITCSLVACQFQLVVEIALKSAGNCDKVHKL